MALDDNSFRELPQAAGQAQVIDWVAARLADSPSYFGHGAADAFDEASWLVKCAAGLDASAPSLQADSQVPAATVARIRSLVERRVNERIPMAYLLNEAWFAGTAYYVDERVLVPRSPIAELIERRFAPWLAGDAPGRILEIGTGSGCIALSCALEFPQAEVVATDTSEGALEVARINRARVGLEGRVRILKSDLYEAVTGRFDLIVSNPPYVPSRELLDVPVEYRHEPVLGLDGGEDGLDLVRTIVDRASAYLEKDGLLVIEVGHIWNNLEKAFPRLPFTWIELEHGGEGVAAISAAAIADATG